VIDSCLTSKSLKQTVTRLSKSVKDLEPELELEKNSLGDRTQGFLLEFMRILIL